MWLRMVFDMAASSGTPDARREERERLVERLLAAVAPALVHGEPEERQQLPVGKPLHVPLPASAGQQDLRAAVRAFERLAHERHD